MFYTFLQVVKVERFSLVQLGRKLKSNCPVRLLRRLDCNRREATRNWGSYEYFSRC